MTSPDPRLSSLAGLLFQLDAAQSELARVDRYYDGHQPLNFLAPEIRAQVGARLTSLVINWPRVIADSVQRRTYVEGFRVGDSGGIDGELARLWQENDLDEGSQLAQLDALVHGSAYLMVWGNDRDPLTPRITVESAHQVTVKRDPGDLRRISSAVKQWSDGTNDYATLYLPDEVVPFFRRTSDTGNPGPWLPAGEPIPNPLGAVPVVPLVNKPRTLKLSGESELTDVIPLADAVNKLATDMMVSSEFHASVRRYATGIQIPSGPDKERLQAEVAAYWDRATKGKTWLAGEGVQFGQFAEASLDNFVSAISLLTAQIAAVAGLPPHFLGINTDNPASADAIRAAEATLVERAHAKQRTWSGAYEQAMRLAVAARDGIRLDEVPGELRRMETVWRDPATPTPAQSMDAAVKGVQAGIYDEVAAQESVGLSPQQRDAIADRRESARVTAATADVVAKLALAAQLQSDQGLSQQAAFAAVGLLQAASAIGAPTRRTIERDPQGNIAAIVEES